MGSIVICVSLAKGLGMFSSDDTFFFLGQFLVQVIFFEEGVNRIKIDAHSSNLCLFSARLIGQCKTHIQPCQYQY